MTEVKEPAMATELRAAATKLYDADFYVWAVEQAELLRAGRFEALDLDHLIEEVEGLADTKLSVVLNSAAASRPGGTDSAARPARRS